MGVMADKIKSNKKQLAKAGRKTIQKIYKSGGAPESYAHAQAMQKAQKRQAKQKNVQKKEQKTSTFTKVMNVLSAGSSASAKLFSSASKGSSFASSMRDAGKQFKKSIQGKSSYTWGEAFDTGYEKNKTQKYLWDLYSASISEGSYRDDKGQWKHADGSKVDSSLARSAMGTAGDFVLDPVNLIPGGALTKPLRVVAKGSGASIKTVERLGDAYKVANNLPSTANVPKASKLIEQELKTARLTNPTAKRADIISGLSAQSVKNELKKNASMRRLTDSQLDELATSTANNLQKTVFHTEQTTEDILSRMKGYSNTPFDKARQALASAKLSAVEKMISIGDDTIAPAYNTLTEALRTNRVTSAFSKSSATERMIKGSILNGDTTPSFWGVKKVFDDGTAKAMIDEHTYETVRTLSELEKKLSNEEKLKLLSSIERGDFAVARRIFNIQGNTETQKKIMEELRGIIKEDVDKNVSSAQRMFYELNGSTGGLDSAIDDVLGSIKFSAIDKMFPNIDYHLTFRKMLDNMRKFRESGQTASGFSNITTLYSKPELRQRVETMLKQLEKGTVDEKQMIKMFAQNVGTEDFYNLMKENAVRKTVTEDGSIVISAQNTANEGLLLRAMRDSSSNGALEQAYRNLKADTLLAETAGLDETAWKTSKDLIREVEETIKFHPEKRLGEVLASASRTNREMLIKSFYETADGYTALEDMIRNGDDLWKRSTENYTVRSKEQFVVDNDADYAMMRDMNEIIEILKGETDIPALGHSFSLEKIQRMEDSINSFISKGRKFKEEDSIESKLAELMTSEMDDIINAEYSAGKMRSNVYSELMGGGRQYIPHTATEEYNRFRGVKNNAFTNIYSPVFNSYNRTHSPLETFNEVGIMHNPNWERDEALLNITSSIKDVQEQLSVLERQQDDALHDLSLNYDNLATEEQAEIDRQMDELTDSYNTERRDLETALDELTQEYNSTISIPSKGELLQKLKTDFTSIYLDRSLHSNNLLYAEDASNFLYRYGGTPIPMKNAEDVEKAFNIATEGSKLKVGVTYSSLKNHIAQEANKRIDSWVDDYVEGIVNKRNSFDTSSPLNKLALESTADEIQRDIIGTIEELRVLEEERFNLAESIFTHSTKDFSSEYSTEIERIMNNINTTKKLGTGREDILSLQYEELKRATEKHMEALTNNSEDFADLIECYKEYGQLMEEFDELRRQVDSARDWLKMIKKRGGSEVVTEEQVAALKHRIKEDAELLEEHGMGWDALYSSIAEEVLGTDEKRLGLFSGNIPMQELTREQAQAIQGLGLETFVMNEDLMNEVNVLSKAQYIAGQNMFVNAYDRFIQHQKMLNTVTSPAFHIQNALGNAYQSFLANGMNALSPVYTRVVREVLSNKTPEKVITLGGREYTYSYLASLLREQGIISEGFRFDNIDDFAKVEQKYTVTKDGIKFTPLADSIGETLKEAVSPKKKFDNIRTIIATEGKYKSKAGNFADKVMSTTEELFNNNIGSQLENTQRGSLYLSALADGNSTIDSARIVNDFLFDYGELTDFEKEVMKRIIPFYTYSKKNLGMHLKTLLTHPERLTPLGKIYNEYEHNEDIQEIVNRFVPAGKDAHYGMIPNKDKGLWRSSYWQIPGTRAGFDLKLPINNALQYDFKNKDMSSEDYGEVTLPSFSSQMVGIVNNPIVNTAYTMLTGSKPRTYSDNDKNKGVGDKAKESVLGLLGQPTQLLGDIYSFNKKMKDIEKKNSNKEYKDDDAYRKQKAKAQRTLINRVSTFLAFPVDVNMNDLRDVNPYKNYSKNGNEWWSGITQEQNEEIYNNTIGARHDYNLELRGNALQYDWNEGSSPWKYNDKYGGDIMKFINEVNPATGNTWRYIPETYQEEVEKGKTSLSYEEWLREYGFIR